MKAPVRELDDNASSNHAPEQPGPAEGGNPDGPAAPVAAAPPNASGQPRKRKTPRLVIAHDITAAGPPTRPVLSSDLIQAPESSGAAFQASGRALPTTVAVVVAAAAATASVGFWWSSAPRVAAPLSDRAANLNVSNRSQAAARPSSAATSGVNKGGAGATPAGDAPDIAFLLKTGTELMAIADIAAARLMFQHAAEAGSAEAAFALAETYDPLVSRKRGRRDAVTLDITRARSWYEKARTLGSAAAQERIARLAQLPE